MKNFKIITAIFFLLLFSIKVKAQWWTTGNNPFFGDFLGSTSTTVPLELKTTQAQPINFYTNNSATPYVVISTTGDLTVTGNIISNNSINLTTSTSAFQIGGIPVLTFGSTGNPNNLFVGTANVTVAKTLFAANVVLHTANQPDIDLQEKIKELENELALVKQQMATIQKLLIAKN
ncbi:MAG: hypothetical protein RL065_943 [Bacteroidota bacterium]